MLTTQKGKSWFTKEMRKAKDKSLLGHGDKRQFTCLASTSAAGLMLPHSLVFAGKGSGSLPQWFPKIRNAHVKAVAYHLRSSVSGMTKRKSEKKAHNSSSYTFSVRKNCATSVDLSGVLRPLILLIEAPERAVKHPGVPRRGCLAAGYI